MYFIFTNMSIFCLLLLSPLCTKAPQGLKKTIKFYFHLCQFLEILYFFPLQKKHPKRILCIVFNFYFYFINISYLLLLSFLFLKNKIFYLYFWQHFPKTLIKFMQSKVFGLKTMNSVWKESTRNWFILIHSNFSLYFLYINF